jgi:hypothetical protein
VLDLVRRAVDVLGDGRLAVVPKLLADVPNGLSRRAETLGRLLDLAGEADRSLLLHLTDDLASGLPGLLDHRASGLLPLLHHPGEPALVSWRMAGSLWVKELPLETELPLLVGSMLVPPVFAGLPTYTVGRRRSATG